MHHRPQEVASGEPGAADTQRRAISNRLRRAAQVDKTAGADTRTTLKMRRTVIGACAGTLIEFFDYASYAYLASTIAIVFFPANDSSTATLEVWGIFAVSFLVRPLGGLFWGYVGDRIGRPRTLSFTIIGTGLSTTIIGLLPGYASIGALAPILLLTVRIIQGFCASGEYAGAAVLLGEHAPASRRARYVSFIAIGNAGGFLAASFFVTAIHSALAASDVESWGWRIPFLLAAPLTLIAWYIRRNIEETPDFVALKHDQPHVKQPFFASLAPHWKVLSRLLLVMGLNAGAYYLILTYMASYIEEEVGLTSVQSNIIITVSLILYLPTLFFLAGFSDKIGRKPLLLINGSLFVLFGLPAFLLLDRGQFVTAFVIQMIMVTIFAMSDSTFATFFVESLPVNVRFSGFSILFNFGVAIFAGTTPLIATWLIGVTGTSIAPAFVLMALGVMGLLALARLPETAPVRTHRVGNNAR